MTDTMIANLPDSASALVAAGLYHGAPATSARPMPVPPEAALDATRAARVDLYCDHETDALQHIRLARRLLEHAPIDAGASLRHLEHASWSVVRHHYREAVAELDAALDELRPSGR